MAELQVNNVLLPPVGSQAQAARAAQQAASVSFAQTLAAAQEEENGVRFSKHALERLADRNVRLDSGEMQKLGRAVAQAAGHGLRDSLVLLDGLAFIVDVPGKTVVTAMPVGEQADHVFTNIDGAVVV